MCLLVEKRPHVCVPLQVRSMEILDQLEEGPRGVYSGVRLLG